MFERRLKLLLVLLAVPVAAVMVRLVDLQIMHASAYRAEAEGLLHKRPQILPCLRGDITDREGTPLAYDAPAWEICVHYSVIARDVKVFFEASPENQQAVSNKGRNELDGQGGINRCWYAIADLTGNSIEELMERAERIDLQVQRIRRSVSDRLGVETTVAEEKMSHPVVKGLNREQQVEALLRLAAHEVVTVQPSHVRQYAGGEAVGQFLGLLREVGPEQIEDDPRVDDELARYKPGDLFGFCGVEALGEQWLRGRRGCIRENILGQLLAPPVQPSDGETLRLTIDLPLQQSLYNRLAAAVARYPYSTGGAAVVLDIPSRQVLAMVSCPSFDPNIPWAGRLLLAQDQLHRPTSFRVIGQGRCYPPGSTVKPMILAAALTDGVVGPTETILCRGWLLPDVPNKWRCTATWGHGQVDPVYSIQHSCNVFYYHMGQRLGVSGLADWMSEFGLGRPSGIGLPGEQRGNVPSQGGKGDAHNMGIGQGRLEVTPIQAANMIATIASGEYRPVSLWLDDPETREASRLGVPEPYWRIVRRGLYKVVNEPGGTAYEYGRLQDESDYCLLGKTGSAEPPPQESLYTCRFPDGRVEIIRAVNRRALLDRYPDDQKPQITHQGPAAEYPTHGWFVGYLAPRERYEDPIVDGAVSVAVAVVIEYAGHGGQVAAPVARDMVRSVLLRYRGAHDLSPVPEAF